MENGVDLALRGTNAVKQLRLNNLRNGITFMINDRNLPGKQCYMEYPDKTIKLETVSSSGMDFQVIRVLSEKESAALRAKYNFADA